MLKPFLKSGCLYAQNLLTACRTVIRIARHKRERIHIARKRCLLYLQMECNISVGIFDLKGTHPAAVCRQAIHVKLRVHRTAFERSVFRQNISVFCDQIMSGIDNILCGLSLARRCINVAAYQPRRLSVYQRSSVRCLSRYLIGGGQIGDHRSSRHRVARARRHRSPQILTDFNTDAQVRKLLARKQKVCVYRDCFSLFESNLRTQIPSRRKMAQLIELIVVRNKCLRHQAKNVSA